MAAACIPSVLNLESVAESQRAAAWARCAGTFFPGLSVTKPPVNPVMGSIEGLTFGPGQLWSIQSPPVLIGYEPAPRSNEPAIFSVMLQLDGTTHVAQLERACRLARGEFCFIDGEAPFEMEVTEPLSRVMFLQMPRHAVVGRHAGIESDTAVRFSAHEPGAAILRNLLLNILEVGPSLFAEQRAAALAAVIQLLGIPNLREPFGDLAPAEHRLHATLAFIDAQLSDPTLNAERVAVSQGLSRRRLDQILFERLGSSLSAQIWARRLNQAASDLRDPRFERRTITEIAFGVGFEDAAHFARAFKRQFGVTPWEWRTG
jgi:AraC family transcriptional regulator, positive regulator of tynA and feaB